MTSIGCQSYCLRDHEQLRNEKNAIFEPIENSKKSQIGQVLCQEEGKCRSGDPKSLQISLVKVNLSDITLLEGLLAVYYASKQAIFSKISIKNGRKINFFF